MSKRCDISIDKEGKNFLVTLSCPTDIFTSKDFKYPSEVLTKIWEYVSFKSSAKFARSVVTSEAAEEKIDFICKAARRLF